MISRKSLHWSLQLGQAAWGLILAGATVLGSAYLGQSRDYLSSVIDDRSPVSRAALMSGGAPSEVLLEGRISAANEVLTQGLVAYERSRAVRDIRDDIVWVADLTRNPALLIDLPDGRVEIGGGYAFGGELLSYHDAQYRHQGLAAGDAVLVIGKMQAGSGATLLETAYLVRGTRAGFARSRLNLMALAIGSALVLIGLALMAWLLHKGYSPFGHWKTGRRE